MNWIETKIYTTSVGIEYLTAHLLEINITSFVIEDKNDLEKILHENKDRWDFIDDSLCDSFVDTPNIKIYIPDNSQGVELLNNLKTLLNNLKLNDCDNIFGSLNLEFTNVKEEDWENNWKKYFKPINIGKNLVIKPSWEEYENSDNKIILEIDPSSSFGTGTHATTKLCLEELERSIKPNCKVLDVGCGSGILSIASILFGASHVDSIDIDENCINVTSENFKKNNIEKHKFTTYLGNLIEDEELKNSILSNKYDVIVSNIIAGIILKMLDLFKQILAESGTLILSGIIESQRDLLVENLEKHSFEIFEILKEDEWISIVAKIKTS